MAAIENNGLIMEVTSHGELNVNNGVKDDISDSMVNNDQICVTDEDMLNDVLSNTQEASFPDSVQLQYTNISDENGVLQDGAILEEADGQVVHFITNDDEDPSDNAQLTNNFVDGNTATFDGNDTEIMQTPDQNVNVQFSTFQNQQMTTFQAAPSQVIIQNPDVTDSIQPVQQVLLTQSVNKQDPAPLGSSLNPIRIIQQGNQYTPVQQLTTDQLQQIMHVVQQQQAAKAGSSVLYNAQTNTKIVYRVIYPSQLHKDSDNTDSATLANSLPKRVYKKRMKEEEEKIEGPELSKEEKEMRKKMRPKTRSGRISKPPKHMVSDYKHIHVLDYDEDYDDDDGGYSDFKNSEAEDGEEIPIRTNDDLVTYGLDSYKPKKWKCITCGKAYIGRAGLGRHLRINPSHGAIDPDGDGDMEPPDPNITPPDPPDESQLGIPVTPNGGLIAANSTGSFSEDSRDSAVSLTHTQTPQPRGRGRGRGRGHWRGRGAWRGVDAATRRKNKLKEIVRECTDEELMEIVLPHLAKVITLWEFLLMKVEQGSPPGDVHVDSVYREYENLHSHVRNLCQKYLELIPQLEPVQDSQKVLQVDNKVIAEALGLEMGTHKVKAIQDNDSELQYRYKFLTTNTEFIKRSVLKRTVEVVSPEEMISPSKKPKPTAHVKTRNVLEKTEAQCGKESDNVVIVTNNRGSPSKGVTMSPMINKSQPLTSNIKVLPPMSVVGFGNSKAAYSGKTVSLLSSNSSTSSIASPIQSSTITSSPQKIIIVSGMNQSGLGSTALTSTPKVVGQKSVVTSLTTAVPLSAPVTSQPAGQIITLTNGQVNSQSGIIINDNGSATYTVADLTNNVQDGRQSINSVAVNSGVQQQVIIKLPPVTSTQQFLQPKLVLHGNEMNMLNSIPQSASGFVQLNPGLQTILPSDDTLSVQSSPNSLQSSVLYTFANGSGAASSDKVVLINSDTVYLNDTTDSFPVLQTDINDSTSQNSYTTSDGVLVNGNSSSQSDNKNHMDQESGSILNTGDSEQFLTTLPLEGRDHTVEFRSDQEFDGANLDGIACNGSTDDMDPGAVNGQDGLGDDEMGQVETMQVPAANIYQTEDGLIFIQNPDGTTLQLQGSDGQPVSMETVQALLGMDIDTQLITAENSQ
ncbi:uncharacterized protein LOC128209528 [Mya arenaria]|uniref:uncharacterized protein LOC128209528 n=1 Tax=Mya arenaria TaxID=6604 RepID=UPI0022E89AAA|nr:uncharacterized protein LOC128209528 [Mya arenaria]